MGVRITHGRTDEHDRGSLKGWRCDPKQPSKRWTKVPRATLQQQEMLLRYQWMLWLDALELRCRRHQRWARPVASPKMSTATGLGDRSPRRSHLDRLLRGRVMAPGQKGGLAGKSRTRQWRRMESRMSCVDDSGWQRACRARPRAGLPRSIRWLQHGHPAPDVQSNMLQPLQIVTAEQR